MKTLYLDLSAAFNLIKESRFVYLEKGTETTAGGGDAYLHNEVSQAVERLARYREELNKRLNTLNRDNPKYKLYEKTYNELTDMQERLGKNLDENDSKKQIVINETFNRINQIFSNRHLSILRSVMIARELKEIKKAFKTRDDINADRIIPLFSMLRKFSNAADVVDGKLMGVNGVFARKDGDILKLWVNKRLYVFKPRVINGEWHIFDKKGKPLYKLPKSEHGGYAMGGLVEDKKQKLVQKNEKIKQGPELTKRATEDKKIAYRAPAEKPKETGAEIAGKKLSDAENERISGNSKAINNFINDWDDIDDFIDTLKTNDKPLQQILSDYGFKPPFVSNEIDDKSYNRYRLIIDDNKNGGTLKIEKLRLADASNTKSTLGLKYIALEKTGDNSVKIKQEPKNTKEDFAEKESAKDNEWRLAALKAANDLYKEVGNNDKIKEFAKNLIAAENIRLDERTLEDKAVIYGKYTEFAVKFKNKITYARNALQNVETPKKQLEKMINNALAILPRNSQNTYAERFKKDLDLNLGTAKKRAPEEGGKPQA